MALDICAQQTNQNNSNIIPPPPTISIEDGSKYIGKIVTVHGLVAHIAKKNPDYQILTVIEQGPPYMTMQIIVNHFKLSSRIVKHAHIVTRGKITLIKNVPVIIINHPYQIGFSSD